jgi:hypothetical protein
MSLKFTSAKVLGDGVTVKLQFEKGLSVKQTAINCFSSFSF